MTEIPYVPLPLDLPVSYALGPDSFPRPGVPRGALHEHAWSDSRVFPGTRRRYVVYVPAQYREPEPASLLVFADADWYLERGPGTEAPVVLDNLIHAGAMPATITVFVGAGEPGRRNAEYDVVSGDYARLLVEEIVPAVRGRWAIADDRERWAVAGGSAGGNCAFGVAWHAPDDFRRVLLLVPSFGQLEGGNPYPALIRAAPPRPLRVFVETRTRDLGWNRPRRNSFSETLQVVAALAERGYDLRFVLGEGEHGGNHGDMILPDALRWLWR